MIVMSKSIKKTLAREIDTIKKKSMEILELKKISKIKNALGWA